MSRRERRKWWSFFFHSHWKWLFSATLKADYKQIIRNNEWKAGGFRVHCWPDSSTWKTNRKGQATKQHTFKLCFLIHMPVCNDNTVFPLCRPIKDSCLHIRRMISHLNHSNPKTEKQKMQLQGWIYTSCVVNRLHSFLECRKKKIFIYIYVHIHIYIYII